MIPETIHNAPVYWATLADAADGMLCVSLVDYPAVERDFVVCAVAKRVPIYAVSNEEKRLVRGVLMRADFPIYRNDPDHGEWYVVYSAATIRQMTERFLANGLQNSVNLMHRHGSEVEGVELVQIFLKDTVAGVNPSGFEDIADGSLFGEYHVVNEEVWEAIKTGTYRGFSIEGYFSLSSTPPIFQNNNKMSVLDKFKARLAKILAEFGAVSTDRGALLWDGDEDLKAGLEVYIEGEDGERKPAPDGDYKTEDGKVIKVVSGKVEEIVDDAAQVAAADDDSSSDGDDDMRREVEELRAEVAEHRELLDKILQALEAAKVTIEALKQTPAALPARQAFATGVPAGKTGDVRLDRLAEILGK